jgi:hypothetical protein
MSSVFQMKCKKSAQDATTVTLVPDIDQEGRPPGLAFTQVVLTFSATPPAMYGTAITDGRKFQVSIEPLT